jgi:gamma-glutamyl-gamma-aminobutyrate hydrolase PuuD
VGDSVHHRQTIAASQPTHPVTVAPGSRLAGIFGRGRTDVNSFHHQAASRIGDGLVPTAWATDGTVEAFEGPGGRFLVCVQWHAECLVGRRGHGDLFTELVAAAAGVTARESAPAASARPA